MLNAEFGADKLLDREWGVLSGGAWGRFKRCKGENCCIAELNLPRAYRAYQLKEIVRKRVEEQQAAETILSRVPTEFVRY